MIMGALIPAGFCQKTKEDPHCRLTLHPHLSTINPQMGTLYYGDNLDILRRYSGNFFPSKGTPRLKARVVALRQGDCERIGNGNRQRPTRKAALRLMSSAEYFQNMSGEFPTKIL
jgi:hypothetical protein